MVVTSLVLIYVTLEVTIKYFAFSTLRTPHKALVHFNPDFLNMFAQANGSYEGIPLVSPLFSNARNKKNVSKIITFSTVLLGAWLMFYAPLAVGVYGENVREIVLLNLEYGDLQSFLKGAYILVMLNNVGIMFMPVVDIVHNLSSGTNIRLIKVLIIVPVVMFSSQVQGIELLYVLNASLFICFFQIVLPNYMVIKVEQEQKLSNTEITVSRIRIYLSYVCIGIGLFMMFWGVKLVFTQNNLL